MFLRQHQHIPLTHLPLLPDPTRIPAIRLRAIVILRDTFQQRLKLRIESIAIVFLDRVVVTARGVII
jgi:hypothetical protein